MLEPLDLFILHVLEKVEALLVSTFQHALCHIFGVFFQRLCIWLTGFSIFIFILRVFILWVFLKDQQYHFLSPIWPANKKNNQGAHHRERNVITKPWNFGLPTQHHPSRLAVKSFPFPAPPVDLLWAQRIVFTLGSNIFSLASSWLFLFTHLGSPRIFQTKIISFWTKALGPAWSEFLFSDLGVGSKVLFCKEGLGTIFFWRPWVPLFYFIFFRP